MSKSSSKTDWLKAFRPLFGKYKGRRHPLEYKNTYQLLVAVVLSSRDSDKHINEITPAFFAQYPSMKALASAKPEDLYPYLNSVRSFRNKSKWLCGIAGMIRQDKKIPLNMEGLTELPGIGRKSANVIMSQTDAEMEGVIVDLHVLRVAPRLAVAEGTQAEKIELQLMEALPRKYWRILGMSLSYLGREICRPTNPKCGECVMNPVCWYCKRR